MPLRESDTESKEAAQLSHCLFAEDGLRMAAADPLTPAACFRSPGTVPFALIDFVNAVQKGAGQFSPLALTQCKRRRFDLLQHCRHGRIMDAI